MRRTGLLLTMLICVVACGVDPPLPTIPPTVTVPNPTAVPRPGSITRPPAGYLYHGVFLSGPSGQEDDLTLTDLHAYESLVGKSAAWVYFSHNWYRDRSFPLDTANWIRSAGSIPYIRLMLRSDSRQRHTEPVFTLDRIIAGEFDGDLRAWAEAAREFGSPLIVEYGTEVNNDAYGWNAAWNGGEEMAGYGNPHLFDGPERFRDAYRHIIELSRDVGAVNITWVFHLNSGSRPEVLWNQWERYYPGDAWIDWLGISVYGAGQPTQDYWSDFVITLDEVYPRMTALAPTKPIAVVEFATTSGNPLGDQTQWTASALSNLTAGRWPQVIGFAWWNESWQNDEDPQHDTRMRVQDNLDLTRVFQLWVGVNDRVLGAP